MDTVFYFGFVIQNSIVSSYDTVWMGNSNATIKTAGLIYLAGFIQETGNTVLQLHSPNQRYLSIF